MYMHQPPTASSAVAKAWALRPPNSRTHTGSSCQLPDASVSAARYSARLLQLTLHEFRSYGVYTASLQPLPDCVYLILSL